MTSAATSLKILSTNPLDYAGQLKELFLADDHKNFPKFFDRAYTIAARSGGKSWIGLDAGGRVVLHIARFPRRFTFGERAVTGGVLLDLMAAKSHRTIVPTLTLMRRLTTDSKEAQDVDFLYATPSEVGTAVLRAAGFTKVATLRRFALPLADERWYANVAARAYQAALRLRAWNTGVKAVEHPAQRFDPGAFERPPGAAPALRPVHPSDLYQSLADYPSGTDRWFTFQRGRGSTRPSGAALVRGGADGVATLVSLSREPALELSAIVPPMARALRRAGYRRLSVSTLEETQFGRELTRAGFVPRADQLPMLVVGVTELGAEALRSIESWEITAFDCDPYIQ